MNLNSKYHIVVIKYRLELGHVFDWDKVECIPGNQIIIGEQQLKSFIFKETKNV